MSTSSKAMRVALGTAALCAAVGAACAQGDYPSKPVRIVVPYPPGGAVDQVTRRVAQKLTEQTGQSFFVENKAGATGAIGAQQVAKAAPDGYTLMANDTTYSILPHVFNKLPFDHERAWSRSPPSTSLPWRWWSARNRGSRPCRTWSATPSPTRASSITEPAAPERRRTSRQRHWRAQRRSMSRTFRSRAPARPPWPCCPGPSISRSRRRPA